MLLKELGIRESVLTGPDRTMFTEELNIEQERTSRLVWSFSDFAVLFTGAIKVFIKYKRFGRSQ